MKSCTRNGQLGLLLFVSVLVSSCNKDEYFPTKELIAGVDAYCSRAPDLHSCQQLGACQPAFSFNDEDEFAEPEFEACVANPDLFYPKAPVAEVPVDEANDGSTDGSNDGSTDGSVDGSVDGSTDGSVDGSVDGSTGGTTDGSTTGGTTDGSTTGGTTDGSTTGGTTDGSTTGGTTDGSTTGGTNPGSSPSSSSSDNANTGGNNGSSPDSDENEAPAPEVVQEGPVSPDIKEAYETNCKNLDPKYMYVKNLIKKGKVVGSQSKVKICHLTGNGSAHTIIIACPALKAHVKHHDDTIGACAQ
ncbi:MAG TPA: hypothetical protein VNJ08_00040 [Bacteriovoracaceae bacterium]|nr:hypothetical protein [Bacteriovoracaceae bacterium]